MYDFKIITDSGCDLSAEGYAKLDVHCVPLSVEFKGEVHDDRNDDSLKDFYSGLRAGEVARTSAVNRAKTTTFLPGVSRMSSSVSWKSFCFAELTLINFPAFGSSSYPSVSVLTYPPQIWLSLSILTMMCEAVTAGSPSSSAMASRFSWS